VGVVYGFHRSGCTVREFQLIEVEDRVSPNGVMAMSKHFPKGLDDRMRDIDGEIRKKRGDTLNKNLPTPIPEFSPNAKLDTIRKNTGQESVEDVRKVAKGRRPKG
jgi:hypothetical protein